MEGKGRLLSVPGVASGRGTGFILLWWLAREFFKVFFPKIVQNNFNPEGPGRPGLRQRQAFQVL